MARLLLSVIQVFEITKAIPYYLLTCQCHLMITLNTFLTYSSFKSLFMCILVFQKEQFDRPDVHVLKLLHGLCPVINLSSNTPNGVTNPL